MAEEKLNILQDSKQIEFETLDKYIKKYPWLSILHIIWLVKIKKERPKEFNSELKKHIIYLRDRKKLYRIINDDLWSDMVNGLIEDKKTHGNNDNRDSEGEKELLDFDDVIEYESVTEDSPNEQKPTIPGPVEKDEFSPVEQGTNHPGFSDWIDELEKKDKEDDSDKNKEDLIEKFLEVDPGPIRADKKSSLKGDISKKSVEENESFITDTLAKIYIKQGLYSKAIFAYKKLSLKYPEKSVYFATQIEEIKRIIHNK